VEDIAEHLVKRLKRLPLSYHASFGQKVEEDLKAIAEKLGFKRNDILSK